MDNQSDKHWKKTDRERYLRSILDSGNDAESMLVMSMVSDVQELIARKEYEGANQVLNDIKYVVELSLGERDEHGRHIKAGNRYE